MFTRREIKMMTKGFYPSRCGTLESKKTSNKEVITGVGDIPNRHKRRGNFKGIHKNIGGILKVVGVSKFRSRIQIVSGKRIQHWDKV